MTATGFLTGVATGALATLEAAEVGALAEPAAPAVITSVFAALAAADALLAPGVALAIGVLATDELATGEAATTAVVLAVALAALTGADGATTGVGMAAGAGMAMPGAPEVPAVPAFLAALAAVVAAVILFKSPIFFVSSATRSEASLACRSLAILSSAAALP